MTLSDKRVMGIACKTSWVYPEPELKEKIKEFTNKLIIMKRSYNEDRVSLNKCKLKIIYDKEDKEKDNLKLQNRIIQIDDTLELIIKIFGDKLTKGSDTK